MGTPELIKHWLHHEAQKPIPISRLEDEACWIGYRRCARQLLDLIGLWESSPDARQDYIQLMEKGEDAL